MTIFFLLLGLVLLTLGAEWLVRGAGRLADSFGVPPLIVGLTVVAYGTSAPEMAVSVASGLAGEGDIAVGNVVGSNIFNVLFILGVSALIVPLSVSAQLIRLDVPVMIGVSVLALWLGRDGRFGRGEGVVLAAGVVMYTLWLVIAGRRQQGNPATQQLAAERAESVPGPAWRNGVYIAAGLALLVLGSRWLVSSATAIAHGFGVSDLVIGLTIVAAGTSLPEVATSVVASIRGERDIAVGNVVGSNIFNLLAVLGVSAAVAPDGLPASPAVLRFDLPVMLAVAVACFPIFFSGQLISRWEGALFLFYYVAYTLYLVLAVSDHDSLPLFSAAMLWFVLPLTAITLATAAARSLWHQAHRPR